MASTKNKGRGGDHGTNASVNVQVHDGAGDNISLQYDGSNDVSIKLQDGSSDVSVKVHDAAGSDDISVKVHDGAGGDITVKVHDGSSEDVTVTMRDASGNDVSVKVHETPGHDVNLKVQDGSGDSVSVKVHDGSSGDEISVQVHDGAGDDVSVQVADGSGDTACYCRGTLILTERGEVRVEDLAIGDTVVMVSGEAKPIKWIGRRSYAGRFIAGNRGVLPIVVRAGALAPEIPVRDLWLSPGHALLFDGFLVPAEHLVNGLTIVQALAVDEVEYFHPEFERHEIVLAEGAPAESYVECSNRQGFHNADEFVALYPNAARPSFDYCLPRLKEEMPELAGIRARLFERASELGYSTTPDPDLHLLADGVIVPAGSVTEDRHVFHLDAPAEEVWLASRSGVPAELELLSTDRRCLGVCVERLVLRDDHLRIEISHSHPALCEGFHEDEEGVRRWTTGMGQIPEQFLRAFTGGFDIEVHCQPPLPRYSLQPQSPALPRRRARPPSRPSRIATAPNR